MNFIDLHGHYAWDIDDGITSKEDALKALQKAKANNIIGIVATPHFICGKNTTDDIIRFKNRIRELRKLAEPLDIYIFQGCELFLNDQLNNNLDKKLFIPIQKTKYILCEIDVRKDIGSSEELEDFLYEMIINGYKPVIAHVERYFKNKIDLERVAELINMGCVIQINSTSILSSNKSIVYKNAIKLLTNNLVHIIATDTHTPEGTRSPNLLATYEYLSREFDKENLELLFYKNQLAILKNENVIQTLFEKKGLMNNLLRKDRK